VSPRRHLTLLLALLLVLGLGGAGLLWRWQVPAMVERRIERLTGHHATVGSVTLTHRFELLVHDVRIAGAAPFDSQVLARADLVLVQLRGSSGLFSPSQILIDGLDVEYLGTAAGDNLRGLSGTVRPATAATASVGKASTSAPRIEAHNARLRGSVAIPHGPHVGFRVPQMDLLRLPDGRLHASLRGAVFDGEGLASLHASVLTLDRDGDRLALSSSGDMTLDVPGGGTLLDGLGMDASMHGGEAAFELRSGDPTARKLVVTGHFSPQTIELTVDTHDLSLRPLGILAARHALGLENTRASLRAWGVVHRPTMRGSFGIDGGLGGLDILHDSIDLVPWRSQAGSLALQGTVDLATGRIELTGGNLKLLAASLSLAGWLEVIGPLRGSLVLATPRHAPLPCAALLLGQPSPVQQALAGMEVDGRLGFKVAVDFDASAWEEMKLDVTVDPICSVLGEANVLATLLPLLRQASAPLRTPTKLPLGAFHPDFVPLSAMPKHLTGAFLTSEDSKFYRHRGFDLDMIRLALAQDLQNSSFQRGASTITQQLAKNLFLSHRRTLARKLEEAVLTWRLQELLSKERILELYLNVIELGPGIRGVKQAAHEYFGKDVAQLTPLESAHLAALTPNPHALARRFRDGKVDEGWQQRLIDLLGMMKRHGRLSPAELAAARGGKLVLRELGSR
jgi:hypothetical protein